MSRILLVGTDCSMTKMTGRLLKRNGFDVQCAIGTAEAMEAITGTEIAVVVADLELSSREIADFCREVKQYSRAIKLLLISGSEEDEIPILTSGADDWIKKPYQMRILYTRINVLLRQE